MDGKGSLSFLWRVSVHFTQHSAALTMRDECSGSSCVHVSYLTHRCIVDRVKRMGMHTPVWRRVERRMSEHSQAQRDDIVW